MLAFENWAGALARPIATLCLLGTVTGCAATPSARSPEPAAEVSPGPREAASESGAASVQATAGGEAAATSVQAPGDGTDDDGLDADIAELSQDTAAGKPAANAPASETTGRDVVYRVTPQGLVIELDGIHFRPEAKPFKDKNGAYGIELVVTAESFDGRKYWVDQPKAGPLSVAGKVATADGKSTRFVDQREAGGEEPVAANEPHRFRQRWPGRGQPKVWGGQSVTLEVGLWGLRAESDRQRPVRRLFVVEMLAGKRPRATISAPTMDWGN